MNNFKLSSLWHMWIEYIIQIETWNTVSNIMLYNSTYVMLYKWMLYKWKHAVFLGLLFFNWKWYMFYSCYWMFILNLHLSSSYLFCYW